MPALIGAGAGVAVGVVAIAVAAYALLRKRSHVADRGGSGEPDSGGDELDVVPETYEPDTVAPDTCVANSMMSLIRGPENPARPGMGIGEADIWENLSDELV